MAGKPGRSGAPVGNLHGLKRRDIEQRLRCMCEQEHFRRVIQMLDNILDVAATGDLGAAEFITARLDGKPRQPVELTGADEGPIVVADARSLLDGSVMELLERMKTPPDDIGL